MALTSVCRCVCQLRNINRIAIAAGSKLYSSDAINIDAIKGKAVAPSKIPTPEQLGHAVGAEKFELLANLSGDDPFDMTVRRKSKGTRDEPTLIPSMFGKRIVGCICDEDSLAIRWMWLHSGECKCCECGHYYRLVDVEYKDTSTSGSTASKH